MRCEVSRAIRIFGIGVHVLNMDRPELKRGARGDRVPSGSDWVMLNEFSVRFRDIVGGRHA